MIGKPRTGGGKIALANATDVVTAIPGNAQGAWVSADQDIWITVNGAVTSLGTLSAANATILKASSDPIPFVFSRGIDTHIHAAAVSTGGNVWITVV